uniref:Uncharacterized protein n=1 Tax=Electrophorus electricus TaxID=8005 RepID=A0A4W4HEV9_ELEEL
MGNLISRPSCFGQKSKHVRSNEDFLKECYQHQKEWPVPESSPAPTVTSTSTLDNAWRSTPSPAKTPYNGSLPRRTNIPEYRQSPLGQCGTAERRGTLQRRDSGSQWPWKTLSSREVTEVTEVTETVVTEIVEVTEYPAGQKGGDPIITRTVRVLTGAAEELAEVICQYLWGFRSALALKDGFGDPETFQKNLQKLMTWVCEIEELTANQRPPSSEFKVVKAQLQEQKLLQRLLEDRRSSMETMMQEGPHLLEQLQGEDRESAKLQLPHLRNKWEALLLGADRRSA